MAFNNVEHDGGSDGKQNRGQHQELTKSGKPPSGKQRSLTTVRPGMQVSYSIRLRIGYFRALCRGRRLPPSELIESLAEGQQPRGKGRR